MVSNPVMANRPSSDFPAIALGEVHGSHDVSITGGKDDLIWISIRLSLVPDRVEARSLVGRASSLKGRSASYIRGRVGRLRLGMLLAGFRRNESTECSKRGS